MTELRDEIAEECWQADHMRATGKPRNVPWSEAGDDAHRKWLSIADAILAKFQVTDMVAAGWQRRPRYSEIPAEWEQCHTREARDQLARSPYHEYRQIYTPAERT